LLLNMLKEFYREKEKDRCCIAGLPSLSSVL